MTLFATVVALPTELPLGHAQLHRRISTSILLHRDYNRLLFFFFRLEISQLWLILILVPQLPESLP